MANAERAWRARVPYRLLSLLASGALLALGIALIYRRIDWRQIAAVWVNVDPKLMAFAFVAYWLQYPINSIRLQRMILWLTEGSTHGTPPLRFLFRVTCGSGFVAAAAPVGLAGDAAKIVALRVFGSLSIAEAVRCALFDRVVGVQWMCLLGLATLPFQWALGLGYEVVLPQLVIFAGLLAAVGALVILPKILALSPGEFVRRLVRVFADYRSVLSLQRSAIQAVIALLNLFSAASALYLLLLAGGLHVSVWLVVAFVPLLQLVNGLPFLYMGWGGREIAMASTLGAASNLTINETLAVSIAWGVVLIATGLVNGVFLLGDWQIGAKADRAPHVQRAGL